MLSGLRRPSRSGAITVDLLGRAPEGAVVERRADAGDVAPVRVAELDREALLREQRVEKDLMIRVHELSAS